MHLLVQGQQREGEALVQHFVQGRQRRVEKRYISLVFTGAATEERKVEGTGAA
jgi:hypothetical protein